MGIKQELFNIKHIISTNNIYSSSIEKEKYFNEHPDMREIFKKIGETKFMEIRDFEGVSERDQTNCKILDMLGFKELNFISLSSTSISYLKKMCTAYPSTIQDFDDPRLNGSTKLTLEVMGAILLLYPEMKEEYLSIINENQGTSISNLDRYVNVLELHYRFLKSDAELTVKEKQKAELACINKYEHCPLLDICIDYSHRKDHYTELYNTKKPAAYLDEMYTKIVSRYARLPVNLPWERLEKIAAEYHDYVLDTNFKNRSMKRKQIPVFSEKEKGEILSRMTAVISDEPRSITRYYKEKFNDLNGSLRGSDANNIKYIDEELTNKYENLRKRNQKALLGMKTTQYEEFADFIKSKGMGNVTILDCAQHINGFEHKEYIAFVNKMKTTYERKQLLRSYYNKLMDFGSGCFHVTYDQIYKDLYIIDDIEINTNIKSHIIDYMRAHNYSMYMRLFKQITREWVRGNLDIPGLSDADKVPMK